MSVGYKRPPKHTQFAKGKSGNPSGRPKGARNASSMTNIVNMTVPVIVHGVARKMSLNEALLMGLAQRGLAGNTSAACEFIKIAAKFAEKTEAEERATASAPMPITGIVFAPPGHRELISSLEKLGLLEEVEGV